jgi:hypothetical protein
MGAAVVSARFPAAPLGRVSCSVNEGFPSELVVVTERDATRRTVSRKGSRRATWPRGYCANKW